jgi:FecR protein
MVDFFRPSVATLFLGLVTMTGAANAQPAPGSAPSADPPGRVGRLAFLQGTVSYHDAQQDAWSAAAVNTPITTGDSLWTEPTGHDEIAVSGTRVRMDGNTQLDVVALDDSQTRLQLDQGRLDIKTFTFDTGQPYLIATPRGTVALKDQGDYYVHAGSTGDPTVLGVRAGAAEFQSANGETVTLHSGEVAEVSGDGSSMQVRRIESAPPALPAYWAQRDQQITYASVQYLGADVTGYEDLGAYGSWSNDPQYGEVWTPQAVSADWAPYTTGSWSYVGPWGWTWVDSSPWGFAPYHYGRWAQRNNRWFWVPPERQEHAVYAPALVAFVGGTELGVAIGAQNRRPVGWFPLGPREAYVPPYTTDRTYYQRINANARVPEAALNDRWQRAERHEALQANQQNEPLANRRFATVMSADDFAHSRPVQQARLRVAPDRLATAPVAPVAAPPAPTMALAAQPANRPVQPQAANRPGQPAPGQPSMAQTRFANMETIARPAPSAAGQPHQAPGPRIVSTQPTAPGGKPALPTLAPHTGTAPQTPGQQQATPAQPGASGASQANLPPVHEPNANRPGEPPRAVQQPQQHPVEPHPAQAAPQAPQPQHQGQAEPPKPVQPTAPQVQHQAVPVTPQAHPVEPPHAQQAQQPASPPQAQHQAAPPQPQHQEPQHQAAPVAAPQPQHQAPPPPAQAHAPAPAPQPQAAHPAPAAPQPAPHPAPQQAQAPAPAPHPAPAPAAPQKQEEKK